MIRLKKLKMNGLNKISKYTILTSALLCLSACLFPPDGVRLTKINSTSLSIIWNDTSFSYTSGGQTEPGEDGYYVYKTSTQSLADALPSMSISDAAAYRVATLSANSTSTTASFTNGTASFFRVASWRVKNGTTEFQWSPVASTEDFIIHPTISTPPNTPSNIGWYSPAISGDYAIVANPSADSVSPAAPKGAATLLHFASSTWSELSSFTVPSGATYFGSAVSMDGDVATIVGYASGTTATAYVYRNISSTPTLADQLQVDSPDGITAIKVLGGRIVISSSYTSSGVLSTRLYVYDYNAGTGTYPRSAKFGVVGTSAGTLSLTTNRIALANRPVLDGTEDVTVHVEDLNTSTGVWSDSSFTGVTRTGQGAIDARVAVNKDQMAVAGVGDWDQDREGTHGIVNMYQYNGSTHAWDFITSLRGGDQTNSSFGMNLLFKGERVLVYNIDGEEVSQFDATRSWQEGYPVTVVNTPGDIDVSGSRLIAARLAPSVVGAGTVGIVNLNWTQPN